MSNKYYIPKIDEFCVGFEYEELEIVPAYNPKWGFKLKTSTFTEKHMGSLYLSYNLTEDLKEGKIRVKYLDKKDIESFQFVYVKDTGSEMEFQMIIDDHNFYTISVNFFDSLPSVTIELEAHYYVHTLFQGNIKNRLELKKLLNQLKIV